MNLLALETSSRLLSVALLCDGELFERSRDEINGGSALILPWVGELLAEAGVGLAAVDAIAYGAGPGGFTGLRLACSVAQGLAFGAGLPVLGVCSLAALAFASGEHRVYVCVDARMNEAYTAAYEVDVSSVSEILAPTVAAPDRVPLPPGSGWRGVGDGFASHGEVLARHLGSSVDIRNTGCYPTAAAVARLALPAVVRGEAVDASLATPLYVRDKVALTTAERLSRGGLR